MKKLIRIIIMGLALAVMALYPLAAVQENGKPNTKEKKVYTTAHVNPHSPVIDGRGDDPAWQKVEWGGEFVQMKPNEGKAPSQQTRFKILYDDKGIYVLIEALDSEPKKIERRVSRRDDVSGDAVMVLIDSYLDRRTAFCFQASAGGTRGDVAMSENGQREDSSWDPIWSVKTRMHEAGWTAEMHIPFSQLRFSSGENKVWGLEVWRYIHRYQEESLWQFIPQNAPGVVHLFGELKGFAKIKAQHQKELLPYAVAQTERFPAESGNPFATGTDNGLQGGLDGKIGLTSDLTLDFTINPDFGQVEADPSVLNLTAYETYYQEKRPFFVEGKNILTFPLMIGDGDFSMDTLFYSRRIGRSPQYYPELGSQEFADVPMNTSILGALKLTGKTRSGFSLGILDALTGREQATIDLLGSRRQETVEPLTNAFTLRAQKDFREGGTVLGGMITSLNRDIRDSQLDFLHTSAVSGGFDFFHSWKAQTYYVQGSLAFSRVGGSKDAIARTQTSPVHYFQRPDADHLTLDLERTSLWGHSGTVVAGKNGSGKLLYAAGLTWRSPGFETNDLGYLRSADTSMEFIWASYRFLKPFSIFRNVSFNFNQWMGWNFGGEQTFAGGNFGVYGQFKNYWGFSISVNLQGEGLSAGKLRGGPSMKTPSGFMKYFCLYSDERKPLSGSAYYSDGFWKDDWETSRSAGLSLTYRPSRSLSISLQPGFDWGINRFQYVTSVDCGSDKRYILGAIDQQVLSLTMRLNWSLTPELSVQFYGQPFVARGDYSDFKRVTAPRAELVADRFLALSPGLISFDPVSATYAVDEAGDGATDYSFGQPNFHILEFRSNLVARWEFKPGTTLFLVWSQGRMGIPEDANSGMMSSFGDLMQLPSTHVFLVKFSYAFNF